MRVCRSLALALALLIAAGCAGGSREVSGDFRTVSDVTIRLRVEPARTRLGRTIRTSLLLMNNSGRPQTLTFDSGARYDFWATQDGREVWRWSEGGAGSESPSLELEGQSGTQFAATWTPPRAGTYTVHGEVLARGFSGDLTAEVVVEES